MFIRVLFWTYNSSISTNPLAFSGTLRETMVLYSDNHLVLRRLM